MLGKPSFRFICFAFFTSKSLAIEDVQTIRNNDHAHYLEARKDPLGHSMASRIDEIQNKMEEMQRIIEYQAQRLQLLEDHKYVIENVNASEGGSNKYRSSTSDVIFAANIHLGSEYFLPSGTVTSYNQIVINVGNHFDGYMGKFFAPHSGVYEFWLDGKVEQNKHGLVQLRINEQAIKNFSAGDQKSTYCSINGNAVVNLSAYDEVELFINVEISNEHSIKGNGLDYFMFAGRSL